MPMAFLPTRDDLAAELKVFIPKIGRWKHDIACGLCGVEFNYLRGRHHCRYCGASVCGKHSRNRAVVPSSMSTEKQRVCDMCYPKCQYGIPLQRRRGMTTADGANFTLLDVSNSNDPRLNKMDRGRAQTAFRNRPSSGSNSPQSQRSDNNRPWDAAQQWRDQQAARERCAVSEQSRRRNISEPPERHVKKAPVPARNAPQTPPSPPAPLSPFTRQSIAHDVFQMSPKKAKHKHYDSPNHGAKKSSKLLSIRKHSSPPPPASKRFDVPSHQPLDASFASFAGDASFMSSFASVRDTKEQDDIAMQYLASFMKGEGMATVQETNHVTVSHSNAGPMLGMSTVVEMKPASPQELQLASSGSPSQSEALFRKDATTKSQNRKLSVSSVCTVSVSDGDEYEEKALPTVEWEEDESDDEADIEYGPTSRVAALTIEVNHHSSTSHSAWRPPSATTPKEAPPAKFSSAVTFAPDTKPSPPEIPDEGLELMRDIMDLEEQIHEYQCELPKLIDEWKRVEHMASVLRMDARESRDKVKQYQKARAVVSRAIRVGTKYLAEKEYEAAALELSRAAAIERTNPKVWYLLADSRMKLGQLTEAEEACRVSIELQHSAVGVALLGRILHALGRHDDAIQCYLTALGR